jgi:hypothetical protein
MKSICIGWVMLWLGVGRVFAGDAWSKTYSLVGGTLALTNEEANAAWSPVAVLWRFPVATNAALSVERSSQSNTYALATHTITNASSAVWVSDAEYPFVFGEVLRVLSSVTNCQVQVIRKGG